MLRFITAVLVVLSLSGCARIGKPFFWTVKHIDEKYYEKPVYYAGRHPLCQYEGPHIHDDKLGGPVSVSETDPKEIQKKYRYAGMQDSFKELDERW